jgi:hypothetical protein
MATTHEDITQLKTTVFGYANQGGLVQTVADHEDRIVEVEKKQSAISAKWLILMGLVGFAGNSLGQFLLELALSKLG